MELYTKRLHLRPIQSDDEHALFAYRSDPETNKFLSLRPTSVADVADFINRSSRQANLPGTWFQLVIIEQLSGQLIGDIGLHFLEDGFENRQVEIGYTLDTQFRGNGYASEALTGVLDYLFNHLHKHRVIASIDPQNTASIKLIERLAFRKEAHFVKSLFFHGEWVDDIIYGLLSDEWNGRP